MDVRDELLRLLKLAFPVSLVTFVRGYRGPGAYESLAATRERDELAALIVDGAIRDGQLGKLIDHFANAAPAYRQELAAVRGALPRHRGPAKMTEPAEHGAMPAPAIRPTPGDDRLSDDDRPVESITHPPPAVPDHHASPVAAPPQLVNLGFASTDAPGTPLVDRTLGAGEWYVFWVDIAPVEIAGSLSGAAPLTGLHDGDVLDVILFGFPDQLGLGPAHQGRIGIGTGAHRLTFAVRTPSTFRRHALRCNVYHRGLLLQSHLVSAEVTELACDRSGAMRRVCDYNLSARLDTARLGPETQHLLSVFLNDDGAGTHSFRFVTSKPGDPATVESHDGHLDGGKLTDAIAYARGGLQWVAWGTEKEWVTDVDRYRFTTPPDEATLREAYTRLAVRGANLWGMIVTAFRITNDQLGALRETMRRPGKLQIALKESADAVVPMAMVYDYPLDPASTKLTVCAASLAAITAHAALDQAPCFVGDCPHYDDDHVVCLGGFWGFRHDLGLPIHLPGGEVATTVARGAALQGFAAVSTDPAFVERAQHIAHLQALAPGWLDELEDRDVVIARLVAEPRGLIYFYCHGGVTGAKTPFLVVGPPGSDTITAAVLINKELHWQEPARPLVILNGCHTVATTPEVLFSLVSMLAAQSNAAGVVGTEITNFEPIAVTMGTEIVTRFLAGEELGRAVRCARLALLAEGNPLGLIYIPFALPTLRLT